MEPLQVEVPSYAELQNLSSNLSQNCESQDGEMNGTQNEANSRNEANGRSEGEGASQQDATLLDAPEAEPAPDKELQPAPVRPPTPAKKSQGLRVLDYLTSPIVEVVVGHGDSETVLAAHQNLLLESPFLAEPIAKLGESIPRRISLPDEDAEAFSCFLQFQYTNDYSPLQPNNAGQSAQGEIDNGELLLKHARIYTLAEKLGIPELKTLAHSKIHRVNSSSSGEIVYARYVYTNTPADDITIRKPVAAFWATRSHVLRHEAEDEWKKLCLEVPEFAFDVLSIVLDQKEKRSQDKGGGEVQSAVRPRGRKRHRTGL